MVCEILSSPPSPCLYLQHDAWRGQGWGWGRGPFSGPSDRDSGRASLTALPASSAHYAQHPSPRRSQPWRRLAPLLAGVLRGAALSCPTQPGPQSHFRLLSICHLPHTMQALLDLPSKTPGSDHFSRLPHGHPARRHHAPGLEF